MFSDRSDIPKSLVLLVEDENALRDHLARQLADEFEVLATGTGEEALAVLLRRRPDIVAGRRSKVARR